MTKPKNAYLLLCVAGTVLPCSQLLPFLVEHGFDLGLFIQQLFANRVSAFFALDVFVSATVLWAFVAIEGGRAGVRGVWAPVAATLLVGVSLGLPLYMREARLERVARAGLRPAF